ncbi:S8 family peptidase [Stackebrandtia nassauensis]|uniref:Peptidase S8 and S53 subtilisin kexin sedolisin n=1 Tax=Stackebrandtia nassauensis (strain DSM 44728 / CIP 108903 / NRRL B-16338 / NBRC 102104 / LLR-40K-21) TaxID=446470 RepID=D3PW01_STANL|nr:S8 family serine peptidase [Stackebrandtia nassauensis]ADD45122.1 peptidase S8 and S53 subtilisin kexin sedolisin [Stackebrandtia nassauensis DSM 44728]
MRVLRAVAALAVASGTVLAVPATAHADDVRARQWYLTTLDLLEAHKEATGEGVRIGLVDSGIDPSHPDLEDVVVEGEVFGQPTNEQGGNGTADAAILAGRGHGESDGVLGVAPGAEIVSADIAGARQDGQGALVADAIMFLTEKKVDVIAVAVSAPADEKLRVVVQKAAKKGIPVVVAASDTGDSALPYAGIVNAVGSDKDGKPAATDTPVPGEGDADTIAAPSQDLPMALPGGEYGTGSDTSFAAQIIAGTMALVKQKQPELKGEELITAVRDTASGRGKFDEELGYGIVNPTQALKAGATTSGGAASGGVLDGGNTTLALLIAVLGVLGLAALVLIVRLRDRSHRLALLAAPAAPGMSHTGAMPRISTAPPVASGDTGNMPRISDTGTFPRVTDTPPGGTPTPQTPPYGQNRPGR